MSKNIKEILNSISSDILTEEVKTSIETVFNEAIEAKVKDRVDLEVKNAIIKIDEDHSDKLQKLIEAIDNDHTKKLKVVIEKIDADHTTKLQKIIEKYDKEMENGATALRNELVEKLDKYLDVYLDKVIPMKDLKESVENVRAKNIIDEIKKLVALDEDFVSENIKSALIDGKSQIDKLNESLNSKIKENMELESKLNKATAEILLEKKTSGMPGQKKKLVYKILEGKKPSEIESNFSYVIEMIEHDEADMKELLKEKATSQSKVIKEKVDAPKIVEEQKTQSGNENVDDEISYLVENMKKLEKNH